MVDGLNIFSKEKIDLDKLIEVLEIDKKDVFFINKTEEWADKGKQNLVIEYRGLLDDEDNDEYPGYHYYDVTIFNNVIKDKFKNIKLKDIIIDME